MMDQNRTTGSRRLTELLQACSSTAENRSHEFGMCGIWRGGGEEGVLRMVLVQTLGRVRIRVLCHAVQWGGGQTDL